LAGRGPRLPVLGFLAQGALEAGRLIFTARVMHRGTDLAIDGTVIRCKLTRRAKQTHHRAFAFGFRPRTAGHFTRSTTTAIMPRWAQDKIHATVQCRHHVTALWVGYAIGRFIDIVGKTKWAIVARNIDTARISHESTRQTFLARGRASVGIVLARETRQTGSLF